MGIRAKILTTTAALIMMSGTAFAEAHEDVNADTVLATVNGTEITLGHLIMARAQLPEQYNQLPVETLYDGLLGQLIDQQALADTLEAEPTRVRLAMENQIRSLRAGEAIAAFSQEPITEEAIQEAYGQAVAGVEPEAEFNASHILLPTLEEAEAVKAQIDEGADFAETAMEFSTGPSAPNGGNLGWFGLGMMVPPFEAAVIALEPGEVSEPVETQFGWHVVKLNEERTVPLPTLDSMREAIVTNLEDERLLATIDALTEAAEVELLAPEGLDPQILNNTELLED